jgi:hypothetical protein
LVHRTGGLATVALGPNDPHVMRIKCNLSETPTEAISLEVDGFGQTLILPESTLKLNFLISPPSKGHYSGEAVVTKEPLIIHVR